MFEGAPTSKAVGGFGVGLGCLLTHLGMPGQNPRCSQRRLNRLWYILVMMSSVWVTFSQLPLQSGAGVLGRAQARSASWYLKGLQNCTLARNLKN